MRQRGSKKGLWRFDVSVSPLVGEMKADLGVIIPENVSPTANRREAQRQRREMIGRVMFVRGVLQKDYICPSLGVRRCEVLNAITHGRSVRVLILSPSCLGVVAAAASVVSRHGGLRIERDDRGARHRPPRQRRGVTAPGTAEEP